MNKFKKGDKVRAVKERPEDESTVTFIDCMERHLGEEFTIYGETPMGNYEVEENGLVWSGNWLKPIEKVVSKFLEHIEAPHRVKRLVGVEAGDFIYSEDGDKFIVYNIAPGDSFPLQLIKIGGKSSYEINLYGECRSIYANVQFFLEKPKVKKSHSSWYNLHRAENSILFTNYYVTQSEALRAPDPGFGKILRRAVKQTIKYEE